MFLKEKSKLKTLKKKGSGMEEFGKWILYLGLIIAAGITIYKIVGAVTG